jgi:hypothetical protein
MNQSAGGWRAFGLIRDKVLDSTDRQEQNQSSNSLDAGAALLLTLYLRTASIHGGGIANDAYAQVTLNNIVIFKTNIAPSPPEWNDGVTYTLPPIAKSSSFVITISVFKKRWTAVNKFKLVGNLHLSVADLYMRTNQPMLTAQYSLIPASGSFTLGGAICVGIMLREVDKEIPAVPGHPIKLLSDVTLSDNVRSLKLSDAVRRAVKANNYQHFAAYESSSDDSIVMMIYENQRWHPVLTTQPWGSVVGVHLHHAVDRRPFTDETGYHSICNRLAEVKPMKGFKWVGEWTVLFDPNTDVEGYATCNRVSDVFCQHG